MFHAVDKALTGVRKSITEAEKKMEKKIKQVGNDMVETEHKVEKTIKKEGLIGATVHGIGNALEDMLFFTIDELSAARHILGKVGITFGSLTVRMGTTCGVIVPLGNLNNETFNHIEAERLLSKDSELGTATKLLLQLIIKILRVEDRIVQREKNKMVLNDITIWCTTSPEARATFKFVDDDDDESIVKQDTFTRENANKMVV